MGPDLPADVERLAPDLIIVDMALPDRDALEDIRSLSAGTPRPIVMFSDRTIQQRTIVDEAIAAGVCSYNLSGIASQEVKPIVASAIALFRALPSRRDTELAAAKALLEERRLIERAKALSNA